MSAPRRDQVPAPALTLPQQRLVIEARSYAERTTRFYAKKYAGLVERDDIAQCVETGLTESARTFREEPGSPPFGFFAWKRITGLVTEAAKHETREQKVVREAAALCMDQQRLTDPDDAERSEPAPDAPPTSIGPVPARVAAAMVLGLIGEWSHAQAGGGEDLVATARLKQALASALETLPEDARALIEQHYFDGRQLRDIASERQIGYSTLRRHHNDAIDLLAAQMASASGLRDG